MGVSLWGAMLIGAIMQVESSANAGTVSCTFELSTESFTWNRPMQTGSVDGSPDLCNGNAPMSTHTGLPFCAMRVRVSSSFSFALISSLEPAPIDFDPMAALYCPPFSPTNPALNLIGINDDGNIYPNPGIAIFSFDPGEEYILVITSFSNYQGRQFGAFDLTLDGFEFVDGCGCTVGSCEGDANGDGVVNFADITAVLANWLNDYSPNTGLGDANADLVVNFGDVTSVLSAWLTECP